MPKKGINSSYIDSKRVCLWIIKSDHSAKKGLYLEAIWQTVNFIYYIWCLDRQKILITSQLKYKFATNSIRLQWPKLEILALKIPISAMEYTKLTVLSISRIIFSHLQIAQFYNVAVAHPNKQITTIVVWRLLCPISHAHDYSKVSCFLKLPLLKRRFLRPLKVK